MAKERKYAYITAVAVFLTLFGHMFYRVVNVNGSEDYSGYPVMTHAEIVAEFQVLEDKVDQPIESWQAHVDNTVRLQDLQLAITRHRQENPCIGDPRIATDDPFIEVHVNGLWNNLTAKGANYNIEHPEKEGEFQLAHSKLGDYYFTNARKYHPNPGAKAKMWRSLLWFQFGFIPFVILIYYFRIQDEGGSLLYEMMSNPMFPIYLFTWEVGIFKYRATRLRVQVKRMLHFATYVLTAVLSFGSATLKAKDKEGGREGVDESGAKTLVLSGSTHYLSQYLGLDGATFYDGPVVQSTFTMAHPGSGVYANFWKSAPTTSTGVDPNFGYEEDYTLGLSREISGRTLDFSLTYFNVTPLGQLPRGDLLQESLFVTNLIPGLPVGTYLWARNVHPLKGGSPPGGQFVHLGVSKELSLGHSKVSANTEVVYDSGAFGFERAGLWRSRVAFQVPWKKLIFDLPAAQMSSPFTKPGDGRGLECAVGVGLNFALGN